MSLSESLAAFIGGEISEEEIVAEMYKEYTGYNVAPEEVKKIITEVNKNDQTRSR